MAAQLRISLGQHTDRGRKALNQDFHGALIPEEPLLSAKGIAMALADGVSSSKVGGVASEATVKGFLEDYYCTSPAWSVKTSAQRVLMAINSWLYAQTRQSQYRYEADRGYVCTLSALVIKSATAHVFHVGDARVYRLQSGVLERLTEDHRLTVGEGGRTYLSRALGVGAHIEIDYHRLKVEAGDVFVVATDGVHEFLDERLFIGTLHEHAGDLDAAARALVAEAHSRGSPDNLTVQILRVDEVPDFGAREVQQQLAELPPPPELAPRMELDGYRIVRELHSSSRSHVFLAVDVASGEHVVLKSPSIDLRENADYLERFLLEDWIGRRIDSAHVVKPCAQTRKRNYIYSVTEFIEGQTLRQWMIDNPKPSLETVRGVVEQIGKGLIAFHRLEMLHQDLRPENIMIDATGTVKIVDFGSTRVSGLAEIVGSSGPGAILGTAQYTAPEYFLGEAGTTRSDQFSLAVIAYEMLSGRLPYGADVARARSRGAQRKLRYVSVLEDDREIPSWFDDVLGKATHPDPNQRYEELSEFLHDLRVPNRVRFGRGPVPLLERNPLVFWKALCAILVLIILVLLFVRS